MAPISGVRRWPTVSFFVLAYALSGIALAVIGLPQLDNDSGHTAPTSALVMFPVIVVGVGLLWGLWHFPVADSLGAASPHDAYFPAFFAAFVAVLVALRVLIAWLYTNTGSLRMAQSLHASSTGFLVVLGAPAVSAGQEAFWYAAYAGVLWLVVTLVVVLTGPALTGRHRLVSAPDSATATVAQ